MSKRNVFSCLLKLDSRCSLLYHSRQRFNRT